MHIYNIYKSGYNPVTKRKSIVNETFKSYLICKVQISFDVPIL
jgi:hypothetical protein